MSESRERLRRICIAGSGQVAVITALALRRTVPDAEVVVLGLPGDPAAYADRAATALPFSNKLHDRLGISEEAIIQQAAGSHRLLMRYFGWGAERQSGAMAYGAQLDAQWRTRFANEWGGGPRNAAGKRPAGSLAEVLADAGRFAVPPGDMPTPLDDLDYALRWNMPAYRNLLIEMVQQLGVTYLLGDIAALESDGQGGLAAIAVEQQGQIQGKIEADLFVDCSGPAARLLSALPEAKRLDWSTFLPALRLLHAKPQQGMLALEDRASLLPEGWLVEFASVDGLQITLGIAENVSEDIALRALGAEPAEMVTLAPGCTKDAWEGNVVALGDAAASFEPLGHLNLDLAHRQLGLLLEMLPGRSIEPLERAEFNRRAALMAQQVRDTLATHYAAPRARAVFEEKPLPESLLHVLDQFTRRGRLPFREEAALLNQEYMALLGALGFAAGATPQSLSQDPREAEAARSAFETQARAALQFAPPYQQFMAQVMQPQQPAAGGLAGDLQY
jgi:tryptophan halogenase